MRFNRVLLILPKFPGKNQGKSIMVLGVGYISQYLRDNGIANKVVDMRLGYTLRDLKKIIAEYAPDLVGIQIMTYRHDIAYDVITAIKNDKYKIVIGGHHASTIDDDILRETPADYAIRMEGEEAILELCRGEALPNIKNLVYREGNKIIQNELRPFIKDLDKLNFPKYESFELEKYDRQIPIATSRGCPFQCIYCPCAATIGREFRIRSPENVIAELKYWYGRGHRKFAFVDDNFTLLPERVIKLCELIERDRLVDLDIYCQGIRADRLTLDILRVMKKAGFSQLGVGIEVGNDKMLKIIKKGETQMQIEQAVQWAIEVGFDVQFYCMIGLPYETVQDVEDTFKFALKFPIADVHFYNVIPFPKTELFEWIKKNNYFIGDPNAMLTYKEHNSIKPFFQTPELPISERMYLMKKAAKVEKVVLKKYFARKIRPVLGILTAPVVFLFFIGPVRTAIMRTIQNKTIKNLINYTLSKFGVSIHYF